MRGRLHLLDFVLMELQCFKTGDELVVHYAIHPAFG
jgi:hypothetical protein